MRVASSRIPGYNYPRLIAIVNYKPNALEIRQMRKWSGWLFSVLGNTPLSKEHMASKERVV